mgnify:FL=1
MSMIKLVIFDVDGTLVDSESIYVKAAIKNMEVNGYNIPMSVIMGIIGQNRVASRKLIESSQDESFDYDKYIKDYEKIRSEFIKNEPLKLKKGALNILNYCKEHNIKIAIATSTYREKQVKVLTNLGIIGYFDYMVFGDEIKNSKPAPDIYLKVYEHYNLDKDEMIIYEDSNNGILSGYNAGIKVVYIKDIVDVKEDTLALCYKQVKDLDEGIEILKWTPNLLHIA